MRLFDSLSARLVGLFILTAMLLAIVVQVGFRSGARTHLREMTRPHVTEYVSHLLSEIGNPPNRKRIRELAERLSLRIDTRSDASPDDVVLEFPELKFHTHYQPNGREIRVGHRRGRFVLLSAIGGQTIIFSPRDTPAGRGFLWTGLITILGIFALLTLTYHAIRKLFQPVHTIRDGVLQFTGGDLNHRINVKRRDELGELADSVNVMAEEIQNMLDSKRHLLLAVSHELRSPLTRAKVNLELLEDSTERAALAHDLMEMETLIEELLESERLNSRHAPINRTAANPDELIQEVIQKHFSNTEIKSQFTPTAGCVSLDGTRIKLLIRNLLTNALQHTPAGSLHPEITSEFETANWLLTVRDHGPGIPAQHLPQLTEPFYRADASRHRNTGGFGLGLYLCKVIAKAHGGELIIESQEGSGTKVLVRIPLEPS